VQSIVFKQVANQEKSYLADPPLALAPSIALLIAACLDIALSTISSLKCTCWSDGELAILVQAAKAAAKYFSTPSSSSST
jgi:hypothetical protein